MGRVAFVFPGQGSQQVGMGKDAFDTLDVAKSTFEAADAALGYPLTKLCFEGPEDELRLTRNTQPAIVTCSIALFRGLDAAFDVAAGHSLGEYAAHVAAGTITFEDAVRLVHGRGTYMQEAVPVGVGAMAAILKADTAIVEEVCAATEGVVEAVNYNGPGQVVIAGTAEAVAAACVTLKARGARPMPLPVSAPFHCALMRPAEARLAPDLAATTFTDPRVPVYVNVDAAPVTAGDAARDALVRQVSRAVRWEQSVTRMVADGVTLFVEIGPGRVLTGLIGRITKEAKAVSVQTPNDFAAAREAIAAAKAG
jgi:[acyl-carrier-protein] S-malonyltransferase